MVGVHITCEMYNIVEDSFDLLLFDILNQQVKCDV